MNRPTFSAVAALLLLASSLLASVDPVVADPAPQEPCINDAPLVPWVAQGGAQPPEFRAFVEFPEYVKVSHKEQVHLAGAYWGGAIVVSDSVEVYVWSDLSCIRGQASGRPLAAEPDEDGDGVGDLWKVNWERTINAIIRAGDDLDNDDLSNLDEFRWELTPACVPYYGFAISEAAYAQNCRDQESDRYNGTGGDAWLDGDEVAYWNNPQNDPLRIEKAAATDEDRLLDSDDDLVRNVEDPDSDNDSLLDGHEALLHHSYPEHADSDCRPEDVACSDPAAGGLYAPRQGQAGAGDGISDAAELAAWIALGATASRIDFDGDGIVFNLLDPDADADGLTDGKEFLDSQGQARPDRLDTEGDGLPDGDHDGIPGNEEVAWNQDTDLDGRINANDPDSDNDGMPDEWEVTHHFNMVDPSDAILDRDGDLLDNLGEYLNGADPMDADTDNDQLLDGQEVHTYQTSPLLWDHDGDGMPDSYEVRNSFQPRDPVDGPADPDEDSLDTNGDGSLEHPWGNAREYSYGRPLGWDEAVQGPWLLGTLPQNPDTDGDGASDGYEAYYGTDAFTPAADTSGDEDQDGLSFAEEIAGRTNYLDPDTDGDGLCDGGRAPACTLPGSPIGFQPGEATYGSQPWRTDSDRDFLTDIQEAGLWDNRSTGQALDVDGDGINGVVDSDSDGDGLLDGNEAHVHQSKPDVVDSDNDLLPDGEEVKVHGSYPNVKDSDGDGLEDGAEARVHKTKPAKVDTDDDTLSDGVAVNVYHTNPLLRDTDADRMPDAWEVAKGTHPTVSDGNLDPDRDQLPNLEEHTAGTEPQDPDTDGDLMPDGYEHRYGLGPTTPSADADPDNDLLANVVEHATSKTHPTRADTDADGLRDGDEFNTYSTGPLTWDTDSDRISDGQEAGRWTAVGPSAWSTAYDGDGTRSNLHDIDADNDGLTDFEEFFQSRTKPHLPDSDGDGLSDFDEVVTWKGRFDPNDRDTDDDGRNDRVEAAELTDPNRDPDMDGLTNEQESRRNTEVDKADTDCDGMEDGAESSFWGTRWNSGGNRLRNADVDWDGIKDGVEAGWVGTSSHVLYRTLPDKADTDDDGLLDSEEAQNNVQVKPCPEDEDSNSQARTKGMPGIPSPAPTTSSPTLYDSHGVAYGIDSLGVYLVGGYGVRLYILNATTPTAPIPSIDVMLSHSGGPGGHLTDPQDPDSDDDFLLDGEEVSGVRNPYRNDRSDPQGAWGNTDPVKADSDADGIPDGAELGLNVPGLPWMINPNRRDTDSDGLDDPVEDLGKDGAADLTFDPFSGQYSVQASNGEGVVNVSDPSDLDTDDDGVSDLDELRTNSRTSVMDWDTDHDGLSDGLELGKTTPLAHTAIVPVFGLPGWTTWQPCQGTAVAGICIRTTPPDLPDKDLDGLLDGMEDWNHNGVWQDTTFFGDVVAKELSPDNPDSDNDKLGDGRELLYHIRRNGNQPTIHFGSLVRDYGFGAHQLVQDQSNIWETEPRDDDSDNDGVVDGKDMNPLRTDNFLGLLIDNFEFLDNRVDAAGTNQDIELFTSPIVVKFLGLTYQVNVNEGTHVPVPVTRPATTEELVELINPFDEPDFRTAAPADADFGVGFASEIWRVRSLAEKPLVRFQLPEGIDKVNPSDTKVTIQIQLRDDDAGGSDTLDLNSGADTMGQVGFDLLTDSVGSFKETSGYRYFDESEATRTMVGSKVKGYDTNDARLDFRLGDTAPRHFLEALPITKGDAVAHLTDKDRNYFGNQGDLQP